MHIEREKNLVAHLVEAKTAAHAIGDAQRQLERAMCDGDYSTLIAQFQRRNKFAADLRHLVGLIEDHVDALDRFINKEANSFTPAVKELLQAAACASAEYERRKETAEKVA